MQEFLDFESSVEELEGKIAELRALAQNDASVSIADEVKSLETKVQKLLNELYEDLDPWQKAQVARHRNRPLCSDAMTRLPSGAAAIAWIWPMSDVTSSGACPERMR